MDALAIHAVKYSSPASFKMKAGSNREKKESDSESKDDRDPFSPPLLRAGKNAEQQQTFLRVAKEEMERRSRGGGVPYQTPKMEPRVRFASENFELSPNRNRLMRRQVSTELGSNSALEALGWKELMPWEEGLKRTVEWYKTYSVRYANIEQALVAHPRIESAVSAI